MKNFSFKSFVSGLVIAIVLCLTTNVLAETTKSIEAVFGRVKIMVNGSNVTAENLTYNGTTYVPLRTIGELLGAKIDWYDSTKTVKISTQKNSISTESKKELSAKDLKIENLPVHIDIEPPNMIGSVYMSAIYENKSDFTITGYTLKVLLKDTNAIGWLNSLSTVAPNEASPKFTANAPKSGDKNDIEILETKITVINNDDSSGYITYDHKTKTYSYLLVK